jgi:hypothetical protein
MIRAEKVSGARRDGRTELQVLLEFLRSGATLRSPASIAWPQHPRLAMPDA